jgi:hypothetical protein
MLAAGDEPAVLDRLRAFRDVGVIDLAVRVVPLGADRESCLASRNRTLTLPLPSGRNDEPLRGWLVQIWILAYFTCVTVEEARHEGGPGDDLTRTPP